MSGHSKQTRTEARLLLWASVHRQSMVGRPHRGCLCTSTHLAGPSSIFWGLGGASLHDPQRLYSMSAVFLVYRFISVDSFLRLILESMSQFLPGGLAKYRTLSRGSFLLRIFKDTSALGLIAIVNIPGSKFTFGPLGCDLPHPRAPSLLLPWRL